MGPCVKPLDRAWHVSTNNANGQGYGGSEFFQTGNPHLDGASRARARRGGQLRRAASLRRPTGLPVRAGCRRWPPGRRPPPWPRPSSTTSDPSLPKQPEKAYTHLISTVPVPGAFTGMSAQTGHQRRSGGLHWAGQTGRLFQARRLTRRTRSDTTSSPTWLPTSPPSISARRTIPRIGRHAASTPAGS